MASKSNTSVSKIPSKIAVSSLINKVTKSIENKLPERTITSILYTALPDKRVMITGFSNIMTVKDIREVFGKVICKAYLSSDHHMFLDYDPEEAGEVYLNTSHADIHINETMSNDDFHKLILYVKVCGNVLHGIVEAMRNQQTKSVKI
jgi:hypothetical protein